MGWNERGVRKLRAVRMCRNQASKPCAHRHRVAHRAGVLGCPKVSVSAEGCANQGPESQSQTPHTDANMPKPKSSQRQESLTRCTFPRALNSPIPHPPSTGQTADGSGTTHRAVEGGRQARCSGRRFLHTAPTGRSLPRALVWWLCGCRRSVAIRNTMSGLAHACRPSTLQWRRGVLLTWRLTVVVVSCRRPAIGTAATIPVSHPMTRAITIRGTRAACRHLHTTKVRERERAERGKQHHIA